MNFFASCGIDIWLFFLNLTFGSGVSKHTRKLEGSGWSVTGECWLLSAGFEVAKQPFRYSCNCLHVG